MRPNGLSSANLPADTATPETGATPDARFFGLLAFGLLAVCAGYAALVLHSATWTEARQLDAIFPFYKWRTRAYSAAALASAWQALAGAAILLGGITGVLAATPKGRAACALWRREMRGAAAELSGSFRTLPAGQQRIAAWSLAALTAVRAYMSRPAVTPEYDDVPSYELFASKSLLAVSAYYPVPNNHVLSNTVSWLFYHVNPGFWWTMRLPVVLVATVATALLFAGLLRARAGFRPAGLATLLFSLAQLSLYHVAVGRGYWLLTALAAVVFFSTLALRAAAPHPRAAWTGLVVGSVLGAYTVPTFALVLASALSWLGLAFLQQRAGRPLAWLVAMGAAATAGSLLLYAPLLFISGPTIFFGNGFVTPHPWAEFLAGLPAYLWETEGFLAGQMKVGSLLTVAGLTGAWLLLRRARRGRLPAALAAPWQRLAPAALWFMLFPIAMLAAQRVFAPGRTLLYKAFFFFVLLALVVEWLLRLDSARARRWLRPALSVAALLWCTYQFTSLWRDNRPPRRRNQALHAAFLWLDQHPRGPILVPESTHSLFVRMYLHAERPGQQWPIDAYPYPGRAYTYVLAFPGHHGEFQPRFAYPPAFHNEQVDIYRVAPPAPGQHPEPGLPSYWYQVQ